MKSKILFRVIIMICILPLNVFAQLEVQTSGDVEISKDLTVKRDLKVKSYAAIGTDIDNNTALNVYKMGPTSLIPTYGMKLKLTTPPFPNYALYGLYVETYGHKVNSMQYPQPIIGIYGYAVRNPDLSMFTAGVAGIAHYRGGIGVYGGINSPMNTLAVNAKYAGYFSGTTKVSGTLLANTVVINGDTVNIDNIQSLSQETTNRLAQLRPVAYSYKPDSMWKYDEKMQSEMEGTHYGFIAQDVKKVLPELVYEREGELSINYIEMIPILLQEIKRLTIEVEELKKEKSVRSSMYKNILKEEITEAALFQNNPNPFSVETKIEYLLPINTQNAFLYIYDMNGVQIAEYPITTFGESNIIISGGVLKAGMYLYSLVADGQVVDTKRMVLTK